VPGDHVKETGAAHQPWRKELSMIIALRLSLPRITALLNLGKARNLDAGMAARIRSDFLKLFAGAGF